MAARRKHRRFFLIPLIIFGLSLIIVITIATIDLLYTKLVPTTKVDYGVTFSITFAKKLELNPDEVYKSILTDLGVKKVRIPLYWTDIEKTQGSFNFRIYDQMIDLAAQNKAKVILVIGYKVPRWPECFAPDWTIKMSDEQFQQQILNLLTKSVNHYKNRPEIVAWQVENEPLLNFGICKMQNNPVFLKKEVELVRSLDSRPIIVTDSGERGWWIVPMNLSNQMGTTLYRKVWDEVFGPMAYPIPSFYYPLRIYVTQKIFAPKSSGIIISELQAEPWLTPNKEVTQIPATQQAQSFRVEELQEVLNYASHTQIKEQYLWGVEWWYWMKTQGHPEYWEFANNLFK